VAVVQSYGQLKVISTDLRPWYQVGPASIPLNGLAESPAQIYASQPNVRTCVDFLSRAIAQLGPPKAYRRISDTDRVHLAGHQLEQWLSDPNPASTGYRLIEDLIGDMGIYNNAYWLKARLPDRIGLIRLPPQQMLVRGGLLPSEFIWQSYTGEPFSFPPSEIVYFRGYNPSLGDVHSEGPLMGLSHLYTLRHVLNEEAAAGEHREYFWRNASRQEGVIERPKDAPKWNKEQKQDWRKQWQERYAGPMGAGLVAVLEDGMQFKPTSWSMKDSEYLSTRKQTREECASSWHIPLPMVGILDHATFSNIKEQHKQLYADTLGPILEMIEQEIEKQLLPECDDTENVYCEFNIAAKLAGSFEEQASAFRLLVGRPVMTANEARARLNLPKITDDPTADQLAAQQGVAAPTAPEFQPGTAAPGADTSDDSADDEARVRIVVRAALDRQARRLAKLPAVARAEALNPTRCTAELATDLTPILGRRAWDYAATITDETYRRLLEGGDAFSAAREIPPCATA